MRHLRVVLASIFSGLLLLAGLATPAQATPGPHITNSDRQHIKDFFKTYEVPAQNWAPLLRTWESGQPWDSNKGGDPVSVETRDKSDETVQISRFADGSVKVTTVEKPVVELKSGEATPYASVQGCSVYRTSYSATFSGCGVSNQWGNVYLAFNANFESWAGGGKIDWVGNQTGTCWGLSCNQPTWDPQKTSSDYAGPAMQRIHMWVTQTVGVPFSWDTWVQLNVNGSGGWATSS